MFSKSLPLLLGNAPPSLRAAMVGFFDEIYIRAWLDVNNAVGGEKMEAYHLEALRKQRVLDRQAEALLKMEKQKVNEKYNCCFSADLFLLQSSVDKAVQTGVGDCSPVHKKRSHKKKKRTSKSDKKADAIRRDLQRYAYE